MAELAAEWLPVVRGRVKERTSVRYEQLIRVHVLPAIGAERVRSLRPGDVQRVVDGVLATRSAQTALHVYRVTSEMLEEAEGWGMGANVAKRVRAPRPGRPELRIPTAEETCQILEAVAGSNIEGPTLLAAGCGLRLGESLALRRTDVNTDKAELRVTATMYRGGRTAPKSPRSRRKVAMPGFVALWLKGHLAEQAARQIASVAWSEGSYVFDRGGGMPLAVETVSHQFARLAAEVGLGDVRMHDLRHAFATRLFERGVHPKVVSEALGHASIAITLDTYSHVMPSMGRIAADAIEAVLGKEG